MFWAVYLAVLFAAWAMMVREGLWSNAISLVNILISGLAAFGFYAPLVVYLDEMTEGSNTYWLDFVIIWALFVVVMIVCRVVTGLASGTRMRFKNPIDPVGGPIVGLFAAWVLAAFVTATLHTSPMPKDAFGGSLVHGAGEVATKSALTAPDLGWLRFVERATSEGALGAGARWQFKAQAFVDIYADHREKFSKSNSKWLRVPRG